jgi:hypothetical protein
MTLIFSKLLMFNVQLNELLSSREQLTFNAIKFRVNNVRLCLCVYNVLQALPISFLDVLVFSQRTVSLVSSKHYRDSLQDSLGEFLGRLVSAQVGHFLYIFP